MVSVIVPAYKVEDYLADCLNDILNQDYENIEIIVVDDGSPDRSGEMAMEFARRNSRIKILRQKNSGLSEARNSGLKMATGEYITFIDSDDRIAPDYISTLVRTALETGAGISMVGFRMFRDKMPEPDNNQDGGKVRILNPEECVEEILYQRRDTVPSACGKLFLKEIWGDSHFTSGILYEDLDLIPRVCLKGKLIAASDRRIYYYRHNENSITHNFSPRRLDVLGVTERLERDFSALGNSLGEAARDRRLSANFNIFGLCANSGEERYSGVMEECWNLIRRYRFRSLMNPKVRLKNKLGILASYAGGKRLIRLLARKVYR